MLESLCPDASVVLTQNAVTVDARWTPPGREPAVTFTGEVGLRKGCALLALAWPAVRAAVPQASLRVYGPVAPDAADVASDLMAHPGVEYHGTVDQEGVRRAVREAWALVLPSRAEALPRSLLEAMGCGRAVIATDVGGVGHRQYFRLRLNRPPCQSFS